MLPDQNRSKQNRAVTLSQLQRDLMKSLQRLLPRYRPLSS